MGHAAGRSVIPRTTAAPRFRRLLGTTMTTLALVAGVVACSADDDASTTSVLDQVAPTKADIASQAGIEFPASTTGFRLVRISGNQIDVTFQLPLADVDAFARGSGLTLAAGERSITHASPLWDVAITGEFSGGSSNRDSIGRAAEVVPDGDTATVRLTITKP